MTKNVVTMIHSMYARLGVCMCKREPRKNWPDVSPFENDYVRACVRHL